MQQGDRKTHSPAPHHPAIAFRLPAHPTMRRRITVTIMLVAMQLTGCVSSSRIMDLSRLLQVERRKFADGKSTLERVLSAAARQRNARLELAAQPEIVIRAEYLTLMRELEDDETKRLGLPELVAPGIELARYWRLSAEIDLLRAQRTAGHR